jgi:hypothetical protein
MKGENESVRTPLMVSPDSWRLILNKNKRLFGGLAFLVVAVTVDGTTGAADRSVASTLHSQTQLSAVYGQTKTGSIKVDLIGDALARPGCYYLEETTSLLVAIQKAGPPHTSFIATVRRIDGKRILNHEFRFHENATGDVTDAKEFILKNGDSIVVVQPYI